MATTPAQTTASGILKAQLKSWGLSSLYSDVDKLYKDGLGDDAISLRLTETKAYKDRFKANDQRIAAGLAALTPKEYMQVEASYRQVMQSYGLPKGFYDSHSDFTEFIAKDVSPDEINERVKTARDVFLSADPGVKAAMKSIYGLTDGAGIAAILDPDRALPIIQRMATVAKAGSAATRDGLATSKSRFEMYADQGFTADQLSDKFSQIGATRQAETSMAKRFGTSFTQADSEAARIEGTASARRAQQDLYGAEQALFDTRAAADANSLNKRNAGRY